METQSRDRRIAAFIPVRGGSKSIPLKNVKEIAGKPLVFWTVEAALACPAINRVVVSTDSEEIRETVSSVSSKKLEVIGRSPETATDTASTESAMLEFARNDKGFDYIVLIQATSPLLEAGHLEEALEKFFRVGHESMLSVVRQKRFLWGERNGEGVPVNYDPLSRPRRQEHEGFLVENGAFYITSRERLLETECRIGRKTGLYEMPKETYFELDEPSDWKITAGFLAERARARIAGLAKDVALFGIDVDGVLTDGGVQYSEAGEVLMKFNRKDGMAMELLKKRGIEPVLVTKEKGSPQLARRAEKLGVELWSGAEDKERTVERLLQERGLSWENLAYIGDDVNDVGVLRRAQVSFAPSDAASKARDAASLVLEKRGGEGVLREAAEILLGNDEGA